MSVVVNPRDLLLRGTPTRLVPVLLPPNVVVPGLQDLLPNAGIPPAPTGFQAVGALYDVNFRTDPPVFTQGHGYGYTKLYGKVYMGGALPTFADAQALTSFIGQVGSITIGPAVNSRFWVSWVTKDGVEGPPAGGLNGTQGQTGEDAERLVGALTGPGKPFTLVTDPTTLPDGTVVPAGTYTSAAFMQRFVASRGQIGLLAVDDARIAALSATKLVSGTIQVGTHISSSNYVGGQQGWAINGSGGAEFSGVTVRGSIFAQSGQIGGCTITAGGIYSPNYSEYAGWGFDLNGNAQFNQIKIRGRIMGGSYNAYAWPSDGGGGFYLGAEGLLLGNANLGRYIQFTADGSMYAPGLSIDNGALTINQANVIKTLNLAGYSVIVPLFAGFNGNTDTSPEVWRTPNSQTSYQLLVAGSSMIAITNFTAYFQNFHGYGCNIRVISTTGDTWPIGNTSLSAENAAAGSASGFFTAPIDGYYSIQAFVTGEPGSQCTGCSITGLGGKR